MRKVDDGEEKKEKKKERKKRMAFLVATTSLPVDRPNADRLEHRTLVPIHTNLLLLPILTSELCYARLWWKPEGADRALLHNK